MQRSDIGSGLESVASKRRFPEASMPRGWFQIGWSREVRPGEVKPLHYFGCDLVLYRGTSGQLVLLDGYCPHLGANLGYGGTVDGDAIVCPFHGWRWAADGHNVEIPYSSRPNRSKRVRPWPIVEIGETLIMAWFDPDSPEPTWQPPPVPELGAAEYYHAYPSSTRRWERLEMLPEWVPENTVDFPHQKYIHGAMSVPELIRAEADGVVFHSTTKMLFGEGKKSTWLTPDGAAEALATAECWGLGLVVARFSLDRSVHLQAQTPVDETHVDLFTTVAVPRNSAEEGDVPGGAAQKRVEFEFRQVEKDLLIWQHRRVDPHPALALEEARPHKAFADWARQFYSPGSGDA